MGYCLNQLDKLVLMTVPKPVLTKLSIHLRLESCVPTANEKKRLVTIPGDVRSLFVALLVALVAWRILEMNAKMLDGFSAFSAS